MHYTDGSSTAGGRPRRRVVALSPQDAARIARGEVPQAQAEADRRRCKDALTDARSRAGGVFGREAEEGANDVRLLREVPPHWG
ncbi:transcriptional regulator [Actinomyces sp.]|uniref:transcriptional regulator n=1 Tax=Actinomyces sp. TaxID=29317 RepID=UPI0026DC182D|nr:transcriptional regulator [Actinomyces sp.]MDO4900714.1 transcriptional regulator [Actinomyces sp.]